MDCQQARQALDCSRPGRQDWDAPELRAAAEHAQSCAECTREMVDRDRFDLAIADVMQQTPIPDGLQSRLLARLAASGGPLPAAAGTASQIPSSRRRSLQRWMLAAAALVLAIGVVWWQSDASPAALSLDQVFAVLGEQMNSPESDLTKRLEIAFDGSFSAEPPDSVWSRAIGTVSPAGLDLDGRPGHDAAVYRFGTNGVEGLLVVLPRARVANPPVETYPRRSNLRYLPRPQVAWSTDDAVLICVLTRGGLEDLQRELYGAAV